MKVIRVIGLMLIVLLLSACSSSQEESLEEKKPATISVYVYSPAKSIITRGDIGDVSSPDPDEAKKESLITKLQIWVFNHDTGDRIAYYSPESVENLNNGSGDTYQLSVSEAFSQADPKPKVDVYVAANVTSASCGLSFDETTTKTTRSQLEAAQIGTGYFGLSTLTEQAPADGFPMSAVLHGATVTGSAPVFRIPTLSLVRTVSKIRFVFSREKGVKDVKIYSITLNGEMIPEYEYLFLGSGETATLPYHVGSTYVVDAKDFLGGTPLTKICENDDPLAYTYQAGQDAQEYEELIYKAINHKDEDGITSKPLLTAKGPYYLRESDKKLIGTISYQIAGETAGQWEDKDPVTFEMHGAGDFSRNHTWIVYAYYSVSGLVAVTVVLENWIENTTSPHEVHNW